MTLRLSDKQAIVAEVNQMAQTALSVVAAEYSGLTSAMMTKLRAEARRSSVAVCVVRNTLARRAFEGTPFGCMSQELKGPLVLAFAQEEPSAAAKLFHSLAKEEEKLKVRAIAVDGRLFPISQLEAVAHMPTKSQALSQLLAVLKAPMGQLARVLSEPQAKLARTLAALRDQRAS